MPSKKKQKNDGRFKTAEYYKEHGLPDPRVASYKARQRNKKFPNRNWKPKFVWKKRFESDPEKRVKLNDDEKIEGPEPLKVIWDNGKKFMETLEKIVESYKKAKSKRSRQIMMDLLFEGKYDQYSSLVQSVFFSRTEIGKRNRRRDAFEKAKRNAQNRLKETAYGFLPDSEALSTMPT